MKKFRLITAVLVAIAINVNAQIPNSGFENWTTVNGYDSLLDWASLNCYSSGVFYAVTKSTDVYPVGSGSYSARIENDTALLSDYSGFGWLCTGGKFLGGPFPDFPITGHPTGLNGYFKFIPQNADTMTIDIYLFLNGNIVSSASFHTSVEVLNWKAFDILLPDYSAADSGHIDLGPWYPSGAISLPRGNSVLYVDNISFDYITVGISEPNSNSTLFNLHPNPASDVVTLSFKNRNTEDVKLDIYNVIGNMVKSVMLNQDNRQINIGDLSNGVYMVTIKSQEFTETQRLIINR